MTARKKPAAPALTAQALDNSTPLTRPLLIESDVFQLDMRRKLSEIAIELDVIAFQLASSEKLRDATQKEASEVCEKEIAAARERMAGKMQDAETLHAGRVKGLRLRDDDLKGMVKGIEAVLSSSVPTS